MRKICVFVCALLSLFSLFLFACKPVNPLYDRVSELRCNIFEGDCDDFSLTAHYGFKETPFTNDGVPCERINLLTFKLVGKEISSATYTLAFENGGQKYSCDFKLNPVTHALNASVEIDEFNLSSFTVNIVCGADKKSVNMTSILPQNTIDYKTALDHLYNDQKDLISAYTDQNGAFGAEIYTRVIVRDNKPYWYIGIASGNGNLKALLVDGFSGKLLAIREVF